MPGVYSTRFTLHTGGRDTFVVPAGKRAVIKCLTGVNVNPSAGGVTCWIGSTPVLAATTAGYQPVEFTGLQLVLNAGNEWHVDATAGCGVQSSGYLLDVAP